MRLKGVLWEGTIKKGPYRRSTRTKRSCLRPVSHLRVTYKRHTYLLFLLSTLGRPFQFSPVTPRELLHGHDLYCRNVSGRTD